MRAPLSVAFREIVEVDVSTASQEVQKLQDQLDAAYKTLQKITFQYP